MVLCHGFIEACDRSGIKRQMERASSVVLCHGFIEARRAATARACRSRRPWCCTTVSLKHLGGYRLAPWPGRPSVVLCHGFIEAP